MNVKSFFYVLIIFLSASKTLKAQEDKSSREKYNFNYGWKLNVGETDGAENAAFNDSKWKAINLPYAWNQDEAFKLVITELSTNIAWYRKTFKLPADANDKKVFIEFDAQFPRQNLKIRIYNDVKPKNDKTPKEFIELKKFYVKP